MNSIKHVDFKNEFENKNNEMIKTSINLSRELSQEKIMKYNKFPCFIKPTVPQTNFVVRKIDDNQDNKIDCPEMKQAGIQIIKTLIPNGTFIPNIIKKIFADHTSQYMQSHNCSIDAMQANQFITISMMIINKVNPNCMGKEWKNAEDNMRIQYESQVDNRQLYSGAVFTRDHSFNKDCTDAKTKCINDQKATDSDCHKKMIVDLSALKYYARGIGKWQIGTLKGDTSVGMVELNAIDIKGDKNALSIIVNGACITANREANSICDTNMERCSVWAFYTPEMIETYKNSLKDIGKDRYGSEGSYQG